MKSESIKNLAGALSKFQSEVKAVKKGAENPFFRSKYADLASIIDAVREPLAANGLSFAQFPSGESGLTSILMHISGEWIEDTFILKPIDGKPQTAGSCLTYARRYALGAMLGISTETDDDGNEASGNTHAARTGYSRKSEPKTVFVEKDPKKQIVALLTDLNLIDPDTATKEAYESAVKRITDLPLKESNYNEIISRLSALRDSS